MKEYILGYKNLEDEELTEFKSEEEAERNAEEWTKIEAETLKKAKERYEEEFAKWQKSQGLYHGEE